MMKKHPALAAIEFSEIPIGMTATDAMVKKAPIAFVRCGTVTHGRYLTIIGGTTASVTEALAEGRSWGGGAVVDWVLLPDVHPQLYDAMLGERRAVGSGALAILETATVAANVRAAEAALKGTPVVLIEIRLADSGLSGKGLSVVQGDLHDVEAAVQLATKVLAEHSLELRATVIARPHEALTNAVGGGTHFGAAKLLDLGGEVE
jgi:microcompartment protein CcmL/EutN